jgi:predicted flap endonuclease-1-like 5' DNA nuclease
MQHGLWLDGFLPSVFPVGLKQVSGDALTGLIIGLILAVITVFLILWGRKQEKAAQQAELKKAPAAATAKPAAPAVKASAVPAKANDLAIIEGIGPKIAKLLNEKGIFTFAQLAEVDVPWLEQILREAHLQFAKPGSWPEQARLAADGKMDELKALQDKLVAGR